MLFYYNIGSDESSSTRVTPQQHSEPKKLNLNGNGNGVLIDEHSLIAQYCQKLHNGDLLTTVPDSPLQLMAEIDAEQRHELELMIRELETENANLQVCTMHHVVRAVLCGRPNTEYSVGGTKYFSE